MQTTAVQSTGTQTVRARTAHLVGLLNRWLGIDDWSDDLIAPADLVRETHAAVQGRVGLRALAAPAAALRLASQFFRATPDDETVVDIVNGLEWQAEDDGIKRDWSAAKAYCEQLRLGGHADWRLPTVAELNSLVDRSRREPAINTDLFPNTKSDWYWTGEPLAKAPKASSPSDYAWLVGFDGGGVYYGNRDGSGFVRAVRRVPAGQ